MPVLYQEEQDPPLIRSLPGERAKRLVTERRKLALGELPAEPEHSFVGRDRELLAAERLLARERYAVLLGEAGEGKTTLAAELARWLVATRRFARAAFVSLEDATDERAVLFALGDQLVASFASRAGREPDKAVALVERALREQATVVVVDNLESVLPAPAGAAADPSFEPKLLAAVVELCRRLREAGETRLVFTSREALPEPFAGNRIRIGRLDRGVAVELVGNVLSERGKRPRAEDAGESEEEIDGLVDAVGRHAGSLVLVARELAESGVRGVRGATERLAELMTAMAERYPDDRERSLFASLELSLRRLPEQTRRRLPRLGVFHGGGHLGVIAQVLGLDTEKDEEAELGRQLVGVGLGELLPNGHLRLHPALGPAVRRELDDAEREESRRLWVGAMTTKSKSS